MYIQYIARNSIFTHARTYIAHNIIAYVHTQHIHCNIPYSGYFWGGKIFVSSEVLASSWKNFHGCGILNHTPVLCGTVSWVKKFVVHLSTTKILPPEKYPLYGSLYICMYMYIHSSYSIYTHACTYTMYNIQHINIHSTYTCTCSIYSTHGIRGCVLTCKVLGSSG